MCLRLGLPKVEEKEDMATEESLKVSLYKIEVYLLKIIPVILAIGDLANTLLSLFEISAPVISYIGGISFLSLAFLYISSYVFRFCEWNRMPLHFIVVNNLINIYDWYIGIPIGLIDMLLVELVLVEITIILTVYLHERNNKKTAAKSYR